ncbi:transcriptional repressor [Bacteroidota bacterium]|nr:transcriptional repressor [Bacteroidota bacterium]MDC3129999.1 transcriptional repressor [Bacteroidota bacterium]
MINKVNYLLKKSGLSITPLRKEVLAFLLENEVSSLDDIKKNIKEFDRVTFYRTVKVLIKFKIIKELSFENKKFLSLNRNIHKSSDSFEQSVYFYCMYCNNLTFLNNKIISFDIEPDYEVHQSESIISGKCNLCN